ncbi:MAG: hypothetical protein HWE39_04625 [Oceanospirillaceae bacterium]|nr:hypothetical protein [Oceanospirillaceae bacterium]
MTNDAKNPTPTLSELLNRLDLSHLPQTEIIRLQAEAARAEYISECVAKVSSKIKALFAARKTEVNASVIRHA